jgi:trans-aconitate methyltransferase
MSTQRPAWRGEEYAGQAAHHRSFDDWFLDAHPPGPADRIVDAGCGTGEFTARLAGIAADGEVIGVDADPSMLATARRRVAANLEFREGTLQALDRVCPRSWADLVVSRAVFHWLPLEDYPRSYAAVREVLRPGGWLHAESGGAGNVRRVVEVLGTIAADLGLGPPAVTFPDAGVVLDLLEDAGFEVPASGVTTVAQRRPFGREGVAGFLRTQAVVAFLAGASDEVRDEFLARTMERVDAFRHPDGSYDVTFVRLHVRCRRPD